jgi:hypothetical protein
LFQTVGRATVASTGEAIDGTNIPHTSPLWIAFVLNCATSIMDLHRVWGHFFFAMLNDLPPQAAAVKRVYSPLPRRDLWRMRNAINRVVTWAIKVWLDATILFFHGLQFSPIFCFNNWRRWLSRASSLPQARLLFPAIPAGSLLGNRASKTCARWGPTVSGGREKTDQ